MDGFRQLKLLFFSWNKRQGETGFTFLEVMAVLTLLGLFFSLVAVNLDLAGFKAETQLKKFFNYLDSRQLEAFRRGRSLELVVAPGESKTTVTTTETEAEGERVFSGLEFIRPASQFRVFISPTGIEAPEKLIIEAGTGQFELTRDRLLVYTRENGHES